MSEEKPVDLLTEELSLQRNSLSTDRLDMSFGEIIGMYERQELIIDPAFQRLFRWNDHQKTRFLESVLLGIPIPPVFVAEDSEGRWELVDGLQRISTLISFFGLLKNLPDKNGWVMCEGDLVKRLEGISIENMPLKFQLNIKRSTCRVEIIRWNSDYDMRYELFNRLNTGGSALTDQEIRNCIFRGVDDSFNKYLEKYAGKEDFKRLIQPTERQVETLYLQELVLRFMSLYKNMDGFKSGYIAEHMTEFMRKAVANGFEQDAGPLLMEVVGMIQKTDLGRKALRFKNGGFSTSLFDAITVGMAENIDYMRMLTPEQLSQCIDALKERPDFRNLTGSSASGKTRVKNRQMIALEHFSGK